MAEPERTISDTEDDDLLVGLRASGLLGPFEVVDWAADSAIGRRQRNEDRWLGDGRHFVVADGMGGRIGGEIAAQVASETVFAGLGDLTEASARHLIERANTAVIGAGGDHEIDELGSTVVALADRGTHALVLSCGDSRVYRWRDDDLELLTVDHTVRNELLLAGVSLEEAADANVRVDALTAFIGQRNQPVPTFGVASYAVFAGDRFLLCSDGVHAQLPPDELRDLMSASTCAEAVDGLVGNALDYGSDNATAVVISYGPVAR